MIFIDATLLPLIEPLAGKLGGVEHFVLFNGPQGGVETELSGQIHDYETLMAAAGDEYNWRVEGENQAMGLCYTSGTTGHPKGALYSHRSMYLHTMAACQAAAIGLTENDVVMPVVPQFHAMAWGLPYAAINVGADLVLPGPHMQPAALAELIETERVTVAAGVPTIWNGLYHDLKQNRRDLSCIRALVVGGSAMPRSLIEAYEKELGVNVVHAWGMTEMSPLGTVSKLLSHHRTVAAGAEVGCQGPPRISNRRRGDAHRQRGGQGTALGRHNHGRTAGARSVGGAGVFQAGWQRRQLYRRRLVPHRGCRHYH